MSPVLNTNVRSDSVFCCKAPTIELAQFTDSWFTAECSTKYTLSPSSFSLFLSFSVLNIKNYNSTFLQHKHCEKILPNMLNFAEYSMLHEIITAFVRQGFRHLNATVLQRQCFFGWKLARRARLLWQPSPRLQCSEMLHIHLHKQRGLVVRGIAPNVGHQAQNYLPVS